MTNSGSGKTLKKALMKSAMGLMSDPRVLKMPGKVQNFTQDNVEKLAKAMALATEDEVKDLRRTVRRLEEEMSRMQRDQKKQ
jgi:hypothetical protein